MLSGGIPLTCIIIGVVGLLIGLGVGIAFGTRRGSEKERHVIETEVGSAKIEAKRILDEAKLKAETRAKDAELEAKQKLLEQQSAFESETKAIRKEQQALEKALRKRDEGIDKRAEALDRREAELRTGEKNVQSSLDSAKQRLKNAEDLENEAGAKLETVAGMTREEARQHIIDDMIAEAKLEASKTIKFLEDEAKEEAEKRAKKLIAIAIQRYAGEYVTERCVRTVPLPSDDVKGRIIGREGRNIRAIEAATGVDLIIDDTPEAVVISAFDPVRREIASQSLQRLIADGRIHPGRIEEVVAKVTEEIEIVIKESGDQAVFELGLRGIHPDVLMMIGRLRYRTSYGQNIWSHSLEVGWLCGMMAAELGLNVKEARRAGLLHDIGKAMDHEMEGSHALIGADFLKKHGESPLIVNAVGAHHAEMPAESVIAHLVMAADALSGARPGARREILETYIKRLEDIERISLSFDGVDKCYAIQAGREVRILVDNSKVSDQEATILSRDVARRIEQELTYPGRIKVCVIRETRASEYAR
ncbi:MAG: ribonuclease Y [Deltaproteobacteria bacterium CG2_30_63_29]|nr:MAG: ribonuclease Y [Deltaproteobacteria bacterium CG2_30_63_29]